MSATKIFLICSILLFGSIGIIAYAKKGRQHEQQKVAQTTPPKAASRMMTAEVSSQAVQDAEGRFPKVDRIEQLFTTGPTKLPIVETVTYESRVSWLKGRPAWIADYAAYFGTSRHFIARSLNGKPDYFSQKVATGAKFNIFKKDRNFQFYLLVDLSQCKMGFYYIDLDTNERVLLKTYSVGVGKIAKTASGCLTPLGKFLLGGKIGIYKPGVLSQYQDKQIEMIQVFGSRWLPFEQPKGYGIHGAPWERDRSGQIFENRDVVGKYESDGCIRMLTEDIEELFSIVITKPTIVEVVIHAFEANLPGIEVASPMRSS
jgi:lipoprotein-anchoring transpeptidase ErfK/SrfK